MLLCCRLSMPMCVCCLSICLLLSIYVCRYVYMPLIHTCSFLRLFVRSFVRILNMVRQFGINIMAMCECTCCCSCYNQIQTRHLRKTICDLPQSVCLSVCLYEHSLRSLLLFFFCFPLIFHKSCKKVCFFLWSSRKDQNCLEFFFFFNDFSFN